MSSWNLALLTDIAITCMVHVMRASCRFGAKPHVGNMTNGLSMSVIHAASRHGAIFRRWAASPPRNGLVTPLAARITCVLYLAPSVIIPAGVHHHLHDQFLGATDQGGHRRR